MSRDCHSEGLRPLSSARRNSPSEQRRDPSSHAPRRAPAKDTVAGTGGCVLSRGSRPQAGSVPQDDVRGDAHGAAGSETRVPRSARQRALPAALITLITLTLLTLAACSGSNEPTRRRLPEGWRLIQKQDYQALYAPSGRLARVLADTDGDGTADAVVFYRADGRPARSELDTNGDHVIDRWETLHRDGTVAISAWSRGNTGTPDTWEYPNAQGVVFQTDFDDDGDGEPDRTEYADVLLAPPAAPETP